MRALIAALRAVARGVSRLRLALRYYSRLRYSWHLAWQKAAR